MSTARPLAFYDALSPGVPGGALESRHDKVLVVRTEQGVAIEFAAMLRYAGGVHMSSDGRVALTWRQAHALAKYLAAV